MIIKYNKELDDHIPSVVGSQDDERINIEDSIRGMDSCVTRHDGKLLRIVYGSHVIMRTYLKKDKHVTRYMVAKLYYEYVSSNCEKMIRVDAPFKHGGIYDTYYVCDITEAYWQIFNRHTPKLVTEECITRSNIPFSRNRVSKMIVCQSHYQSDFYKWAKRARSAMFIVGRRNGNDIMSYVNLVLHSVADEVTRSTNCRGLMVDGYIYDTKAEALSAKLMIKKKFNLECKVKIKRVSWREGGSNLIEGLEWHKTGNVILQ